MRRPRFTVSRLMLLVALVAIGFQAARLARLSSRYASKADEHRREAARDRADLSTVRPADTVEYMGFDRKEFLQEYLKQSCDYNNKIYSKYKDYSLKPWLSPPPDPLPPSPFPTLPILDEMPQIFVTEG